MKKDKPAAVISLGGSMLFDSSEKLKVAYLKELKKMLLRLREEFKLAIVVGGGAVARQYANAVRELTESEFQSDKIGIQATKMNAMLIISTLGDDAYPKVVKDLDQALEAMKQDKIAVGAGLIEGLTTDACTMLLAEKMHCKLVVNASNVDYVYDSDPKKNPNAKRLSQLTHSNLSKMAAEFDTRKAGSHFIFDLIACKLAERSNIELRFVNGSNLQEVEKAITGKEFNGTTVIN